VDIAAVAILAPCALIALIVVVIAIRPSSAHAVSEVLKALSGVLASINPWAAKMPSEHLTTPMVAPRPPIESAATDA
jgi:hypothetical protein